MIQRSGLLLLDKPAGVSSFRSFSTIKRYFPGRKVGHAGTLDPFASGLMLLLCGNATRLAPFITLSDKSYLATFRFGVETDTLDPEGVVVRSAPVPGFADVERAIAAFRGEIAQRPPQFSAIHVGGKRAYREARRGIAVELPERSVNISELSIVAWEAPELMVRIRCSKGTYIRAIARDLGRALESAAYVTTLRRTSVGGFALDDKRIVGPDADESAISGALLSPAEGIRRAASVGICTISDARAAAVSNGVPLALGDFGIPAGSTGVFAVLGSGEELIAVIESDGQRARYRVVLARNSLSD